MYKILVPTDFSVNASNATDFAFEIASRSGAEIALFHCFDEDYDTEGNYVQVFDLAKKSADAALNKVAESYQKHPKHGKIKLGLHTLPGNLVDAIQEIIGITHADLIIMGTRGASGLKEILIGSNAVRVIENVELPVLLVPEAAKLKEVRNILFATDLKSIGNDDALDLLNQMAKLFDAEVRIAHVKPKGKHTRWEEKIEASRIGSLLGDDIRHSFKRIYSSKVLKGIQFYLDLKGDNDMLCMLVRRKSLVEKLFTPEHTKTMAFHSNIPLLLLKE
jgi:nucleotide-binding universal stress UspA family protein